MGVVLAVTPSAPTGFAGLIGQLLTQFVQSGRDDVLNLLSTYLLSTDDPVQPGGRALTADPTLATLNHDIVVAGDALLALVVIALAVRSIFDRSVYSQHDLRAALPLVLVALVLMNASLTLGQMAIDLNNALSSFASGMLSGTMPWSGPLAESGLKSTSLAGDLFQVVVLLALVIVVAILGFAYVIRMAILQVLIVTAPLAAMAIILPATRGLARAWSRLFAVVLFMQPAQLLVLGIATATGLANSSGLGADIYALAILWITLKVPGFLARAIGPGGSLAGITRGLAVQVRHLPIPAPAQGL